MLDMVHIRLPEHMGAPHMLMSVIHSKFFSCAPELRASVDQVEKLLSNIRLNECVRFSC